MEKVKCQDSFSQIPLANRVFQKNSNPAEAPTFKSLSTYMELSHISAACDIMVYTERPTYLSWDIMISLSVDFRIKIFPCSLIQHFILSHIPVIYMGVQSEWVSQNHLWKCMLLSFQKDCISAILISDHSTWAII